MSALLRWLERIGQAFLVTTTGPDGTRFVHVCDPYGPAIITIEADEADEAVCPERPRRRDPEPIGGRATGR